MHLRRLLTVALCGAIVFLGGAFVLGNGTAQPRAVVHVCSAADKQFLQTVSSNMTQLGYWSDELSANDVEPRVVVKQAFSEADQVGATRPEDPTFFQARGMLRVMFTEYGRAIRAKLHGGDAGKHMGVSWRFAYQVHDLLAAAQPQLATMGCDPAPLFKTT